MPSVRSSDRGTGAPDATSAASPSSRPNAIAWAALGAAGERMSRIAVSARVAPAYLFESADATGPREAARLFAAALLCTAEERPCLSCSVCRRVRAGSHPDVHRRGRDKATVISVDALAALLERAHASPREGRRQVFVIDPADAMAPEAVARYLKSLEEPPETTTFVLVTTRPERLPDAVISRCQCVRFAEPSEADLAARLARDATPALEPGRAERIAHLSNGSIERARRLHAIEADRVIETLAAAALSREPNAATTAEATLASLRSRAGAVERDDEGEGDEPAPDATPGERLREAITDVFHALSVACRDRLAGHSEGPLAALSPAAAAAVLERLAVLASHVRRNVAPAALLLETVRTLRSAR